MTMEININIKLEDGDIAILIQSIFEIIKKIPQEKVQINIDPNVHPTINPTGIKINDYEIGTGTANNKVHYENINTSAKTPHDADWNGDSSKNTTEEIYYSDGSTVKKIDNEQKKNEE